MNVRDARFGVVLAVIAIAILLVIAACTIARAEEPKAPSSSSATAPVDSRTFYGYRPTPDELEEVHAIEEAQRALDARGKVLLAFARGRLGMPRSAFLAWSAEARCFISDLAPVASPNR